MKDTLISRREFLKDIGMIGAGVLLSQALGFLLFRKL